MEKLSNIIIANNAEAFNSIIMRIEDQHHLIEKIKKEHFLSSRFLFWEGDNKIIITPFKIEKAVLGQLEALGYKNIECWTPEGKGINLCEEIQNDSIFFNNFKNVLRKNPGVILSTYSYTKEFNSLVERLRKQNLSFNIDQEPKNKAQWLVEYLGSKIGFRIEAKKINIISPEFFICKNKKEIIDAGGWFFNSGKSFVVKAATGEGGWGVIIKERKKTPNLFNKKALLKTLDNDSIWREGPFIVEEFIESKHGDNKSPSVEIFISDNKINITYVCNQIVDKDGKFIGILMGRGCVLDEIKSQVYSIAKKISKRYKNLGYRGFFDIDFIISKKQIAYPVETNVRRTGGTHTFDLARKIYGKNWFDKIVCLSNDYFFYKGGIMKAEEIIKKIEPIMFCKEKKEGVIIIAVKDDEPVIGFVIFAKTKIKAKYIYKKLIKIL